MKEREGESPKKRQITHKKCTETSLGFVKGSRKKLFFSFPECKELFLKYEKKSLVAGPLKNTFCGFPKSVQLLNQKEIPFCYI